MSNLYVRGIAPFEGLEPVTLVDKYEDVELDSYDNRVRMMLQDTTVMEPRDIGFSPCIEFLQLCIKLDGELYVWEEWRL